MVQVSAPVASRTETAGLSFVEWGAVLAGAVLAAAISFVLLTFGAAIGLSATSPWPNSGLSAEVIASLAVFWAMAQQIGSIMLGGYVAGRMRSRWHEPGHEAEFRDGLHGALVWAVAVLISAFLVFMTAGMAASTGADIAGKALVSTTDPMDAVLDTMLGPTATAQAAAPGAPPAGPPTSARPRVANAATGDGTRAEASRILASSVASGSITRLGWSNSFLIVTDRRKDARACSKSPSNNNAYPLYISDQASPERSLILTAISCAV